MQIRKVVLVVLLIILVASFNLSARPNKNIALGFQVGAFATGPVVDIPLGPLALNVGVNYPLLIGWIKTISDMDSDLFKSVFFLSGDLTYPIALGEQFDLKLGVSTLAGTDFKNLMVGTVGVTAKGEYWIPNKNVGLFMHMDVPIGLYAISETESAFGVGAEVPLLGILTTSAGVLWAF